MAMIGAENLTTGLRAIDADIEGLCFLMERIFDPMVECRRRCGGCDHSRCTRIEAIVKYMTRSFARQDALMAEAAYPGDVAHRRDHDALIGQLRGMQALMVCADLDRKLVEDAVKDWTISHNRLCDRPLGNWAVTRRVLT